MSAVRALVSSGHANVRMFVRAFLLYVVGLILGIEDSAGAIRANIITVLIPFS